MNHKRPYALTALIVFLLAAFCLLPSIFAQSATATLSGTVTDQNGAVVPGVAITVINAGTGLQWTATTNDHGDFVIPLLPPSSYTVRAQHDGFYAAQIPNIVLNVGDLRSLKIELKVGDVKETVNVSGETPLINESPAVATVVDRRFVENMPLNGRSFQTLIALTPGVVLTASTFSEQGQFSVNGQRADANYFTVDGASANIGVSAGLGLGQSAGGALPGLGVLGGTNGLVSVDAMQEFRIQTSTFAPEFGRTPGGQVSIVTRSGTNQFHGTAFVYLRNDVLDANNWFANRAGQPKPKDRQNDFGGVFHGPIVKDRAFFFFSYEGLRLRQPLVATTLVPSAATRQTAQATKPEILPYLNAFPLPNGPDSGNGFAQFAASYSNPATLDAYSIRLDHTISSKLSLFGRYNYSPSNNETRAPNGILSNVQPATIKIQTLTLGLTQIVSRRITNEVRVNLSRETGGSFVINDNFGGAVPLTDALLFPTGFSSANGLSGIGITNAGTLLVGKNVNNKQRQFNLVDDLSLLTGSHQLKFGADYRRLTPSSGPRAYSLIANFSGITGATGALAATTQSASVAANQSASLLEQNFSFFGQDTWKVAPRLTFTYGLRWDINPALKGKDAASQLFTVQGLNDPATMTLAAPGPPLFKTSYGNIGPRVGVAYQLRRKQGSEAVLRGGFGVFYDLGLGFLGNITTGFPFTATKSLGSVAFPLTATQAAPPVISQSPPVGTLYAADPDLKLPRTYQWNFAAEQSIGARQTLSASYVGAVGRDLLRVDSLRNPNPNFVSLFVTRNTATSDYHALQMQFTRRLSRGLQALASYTWSHSIDIASNDSNVLNTSTVITSSKADRGNSDFDIRHSFTSALSYDLPVPGKSRLIRGIIGGWAIDNYFTTRSAPPVTLTAASFIFAGTLFSARPTIISGIPLYLYGSQYAGGKIFNNTVPTAAQVASAGCAPLTATNAKGAFCTPTTGQQGSLGRNVLRGFGLWQDDVAIRRQFHFGEKLRLQMRAEFFNIFNHPNFANPVASLTSALFGQSTQTLAAGLGSGGNNGGFNPLYQVGGPRSIQIALKLEF